MTAILEFKGVSYGYQNGVKRLKILENANICFEKGVFYTIIGPSGSGKTTALALAGALDVPQEGAVLFAGNDIRKTGLTGHRKRNVALIFQSYNLINYMTALENVLTGMDIAGRRHENQKQYAMEILKGLGITEDEAKRNVLKLSGGQQQRVAIARALAGNTDIILADEPTGNLDGDTAREIIKIFQDLARIHQKCVIVVSHSQEVADTSDVAYQIKDGSMVQVNK